MIPILDIASPTGTFRVRLRPGEVCVGRAADCDIFIRDKLVSARHAVFWLGPDGRVRVRDLGSTNGLYVNGVRRAETVLRSGDTARLGGTIAVYLEQREGEDGQTTQHDLEVVEEKRKEQTGFDPFAITVGLDEIAADLEAEPGTPESVSAAVLVARTRLSLLHRLGQGVTCDVDLDRILTHIAQVVREGVGPERIAILVSEAEGAPAVRRFARDWRRPGDEEGVYVPRVIVARAMYERKAALYHDVVHDPRFHDEPRLSGAGIRQAMAAPILFGGAVRGAIYADRTALEPPFTAEELYLLGIVAYQSGAVLQNQEMFARERRTLQELRRTQDELVSATRLATIGELLGGVANEINNPMAAIVGFTDLCLASDGCPPRMREDLVRIRDAGVRVKRLMQQLLAFCRRPSDHEAGSFNIEKAVSEILSLRARELEDKGVKLELDFLRGIPPVAGSAQQIQQIILNLVQNAEHALEGREGARIIVRGRCDHRRCLVTVEDNGPGIAPEVLPRIFDPFFTTRPAGRGSGLGLSISLAVAKHHGGNLEAASEQGRGARFTLELPLKKGASVEADQTGVITPLPETVLEAVAAGAPSDREEVAPRTPRRRRVLVCDDEEPIRELMSRGLKKAGFDVVTAASCAKAIAEVRAADFDVVVTDLHLVGPSGIELAEQAAKLKPDLENRIVFVTGDCTSETYQMLLDRGADVLSKPFNLPELAQRVADRIAAAEARGVELPAAD